MSDVQADPRAFPRLREQIGNILLHGNPTVTPVVKGRKNLQGDNHFSRRTRREAVDYQSGFLCPEDSQSIVKRGKSLLNQFVPPREVKSGKHERDKGLISTGRFF